MSTKLICKYEHGHYHDGTDSVVQFRNGQAMVSDETLAVVKKMPQYGNELATVADAQWLTPEQKAGLLAPPAPIPVSGMPLDARVEDLEDRVAALEAKTPEE